MNNRPIDGKIVQIESMKFVFPASPSGVGVDRKTGLPSATTEPQEDFVQVAIKVRNELGETMLGGKDALEMYEIVRRFLNA